MAPNKQAMAPRAIQKPFPRAGRRQAIESVTLNDSDDDKPSTSGRNESVAGFCGSSAAQDPLPDILKVCHTIAFTLRLQIDRYITVRQST